jgi:hypothetical protein
MMHRSLLTHAGRKSSGLVLISLALLSGCTSTIKEPSLYGWRNYEKNLDAYFRTDKSSSDEQLKSMQDDQQLLRAEGKTLPPGYQAHMGLLEGRRGDAESFRNHIEAEKQQFPESAGFMDFLLRNFKKP